VLFPSAGSLPSFQLGFAIPEPVLVDSHNQLPKVILGVKFTEESRSSDRELSPLRP
jgi:hypothetical protein